MGVSTGHRVGAIWRVSPGWQSSRLCKRLLAKSEKPQVVFERLDASDDNAVDIGVQVIDQDAPVIGVGYGNDGRWHAQEAGRPSAEPSIAAESCRILIAAPSAGNSASWTTSTSIPSGASRLTSIVSSGSRAAS